MSNKSRYIKNAVNNTPKEIRNSKEPMGGITLLLGGDFRQTLSVIQRGIRADIVNASLKSSHLWQYVQVLPPLKRNMRLNAASQSFSEILLKVGDGTLDNDNGFITIDTIGTHISSEEVLIEREWPGMKNICKRPAEWIMERALLGTI